MIPGSMIPDRMIEVLEAATANTVQDIGRTGFAPIGVGRSGAMDPVALQVANMLLGNATGAAAIEIQVFPFAVRFTTDTAFAITGADSEPRLDGVPLPPWWAAPARAGQVLRLSPPRDGARSYLAVAGGIDVPAVLGSRSTHLRSAFGGFHGRALEHGDMLPIGPAAQPAMTLGAAAPERPVGPVLTVQALPAAEHDAFPQSAREAFWSAEWRITAQSNRHGYRLSGPELGGGDGFNIRSTPILPGVVQVPPGGAPIVQMSDANSAGGYPKIATVIGADLPLLGQARLGSRVRFAKTNYEAALAAEQAVRAYLARVQRTIGLFRRNGAPG